MFEDDDDDDLLTLGVGGEPDYPLEASSQRRRAPLDFSGLEPVGEPPAGAARPKFGAKLDYSGLEAVEPPSSGVPLPRPRPTGLDFSSLEAVPLPRPRQASAPQPQAADATPIPPSAVEPSIPDESTPTDQIEPYRTLRPLRRKPSTTEPELSEFEKGLGGAVVGTNPKLFGHAAQGFGILLDAPSLRETGDKIAKHGSERLDSYKARVPSYTNIRTDSVGNFISDLGSYAGYHVGSSVGTSAPSLITGTLAGLATANPFVGIGAGAALPSYVQNYGDAFGSAIEDKDIAARIKKGELSEKRVAGITAAAAVLMALLDVFSLGTILSKTALAQAKQDLVRMVTKGMAIGAVTEGSTEGLQEILSLWAQDNLGSNKPLHDKFVSVVDNMLGGFFGGGAMGGTGAAARGAMQSGKPAVVPEQPAASEPPPVVEPPAVSPSTEPLPAATPELPAEEQPTSALVSALDRRALRKRGWTDEQIDLMSPGERAEEIGTEPPPAMAQGDAEDVEQARPALDYSGLVPVSGDGSRTSPAHIEDATDIERAAAQVNPEPSPDQRTAENYRMGHLRWPGLGHAISIETAKGGTRSAADGSWSVPDFPAAYGRIKGTKGADGQQVDAFLGDQVNAATAFVLDQKDPRTGKWDEHKVFLGFPDQRSVEQVYGAAFSDGSAPQRVYGITELTLDQLKHWLRHGNTRRPLAKAPSVEPPSLPMPATERPSAEPISDIAAQARDLSSGANGRRAVYVPAETAAHLRRTGGLRQLSSVGVPLVNFDRQGGVLIARDRGVADDAVRQRESGADIQVIIGGLTGAGHGKPSGASAVVQQVDAAGNVTRERAIVPAEAAAVSAAFHAPGRAVQRVAPEQALARRKAEVDGEAAVADALRAAAISPERVDQADIAEAGRIVAETGADPIDAFEQAAIANVVRDGFATPQETDETYGRGASDAVPGAAASTNGTAAEQEGRQAGTEPAQDIQGQGRQLQGAREARGASAGEGNQRGGRGEAARPASSASEAVATRYTLDQARAIYDRAKVENERAKINLKRVVGQEALRSGSVASSAVEGLRRKVARTQFEMDEVAPYLPEEAAPAPVEPKTPPNMLATLSAGIEAEEAQRGKGSATKPVSAAIEDPLEIPEFLRRTPGPQKTAASAESATDAKPVPAPEPEQATAPSERAERDIREEADRRWRNWVPSREQPSRPRLTRFMRDVRRERKKAEAEKQKTGRRTDTKPQGAQYSIRPRSPSLTGVEIDADRQLFEQLGLSPGRFWANYEYLAKKHPEYFADAAAAKAHVESVLDAPDVAIPQRTGELDLVSRLASGDRLIGFRARLVGGRYNIGTAYVLDPGQLNRMKSGAARAGATVVELTPTGRGSGQGRDDQDTPADEGQQSIRRTPVFYSAIERTIDGARQNRANANQWLGMLRNAPGVKAEEMEWLGLNGWLRSQTGGISKDAVLDYVRANKIEVREVEKGQRSKEQEAELERLKSEYTAARADMDRLGQKTGPLARRRFDRAVARYGDIQRRYVEAQQAMKGGETKFASYTLPGGENYRELLLTMPRKGGMMTFDQFAADYQRQHGGTGISEVERAYDRYRNAEFPDVAVDQTYQSSHWNEANVLAHIRFNDRTIDGKKTLFIEEVQSDWHQAGKKRGYGPVDTKGWRASKRHPNDNGVTSQVDVVDATGRRIETIDAPREWSDEQVLQAARDLREDGAARVPDAPFKTTWPELAMKRMIRYAAEQGYDQIAWTPGSVQADRYDLSKQISELRFEKFGTSGFSKREDIDSNERGRLVAYDHNGTKVIDKHIDQSELPDYIGKDAAEKLMAQEGIYASAAGMASVSRPLSGLDLKVGGEGMSGFYDQILPAAVNKLVKKFGARVGTTVLREEDIQSPDYAVAVETDQGDFEVVRGDSGDVVPEAEGQRYQTLDEADQAAADINYGRWADGNDSAPARAVSAHTLPITPALRDAALGRGFPLFKAGNNLTPSAEQQRADIEGSLTQIIRHLVGPDVRVAFSDTIPLDQGARGWGSAGEAAETAAGMYLPAEHLIRLALHDPAYPGNPLPTALHESYHAIENRLLTPQEMALLERETPRLRSYLNQNVEFVQPNGERAGPGWADSIAGYEARAIAFEHYAMLRATGRSPVGIHIIARRAFEKIMAVLRRVRNALQGLGFRTAEDIFAAAVEGRTAMRSGQDRGAPTGRANIRPAVQGTPGRAEAYAGPYRGWRDALADSRIGYISRLFNAIDIGLTTVNREFGDKFVDLKHIQEAIERHTGEKLPDHLDVHMLIDLYQSRLKPRMEDFERKELKPLLKAMGKAGIDFDMMHKFLYVAHGRERNAHIRERVDPSNQKGSGVEDATLDQWEQELRNTGKWEELATLGARWRAIIDDTQAIQVRSGLKSQTQANSERSVYQNYVPLRGSELNTDDADLPTASHRGVDVRGPETKEALGRYSEADNILKWIVEARLRTIIRSEKAVPGRAMLRLAQIHPNADLYTVERAETRRRRNEVTGLVENYTVTPYVGARNVLAVKVGGDDYFVTIRDPQLLEALKLTPAKEWPMFARALAWLMVQYKSLRTALNPGFFLTNVARDVDEAAITKFASGKKRMWLAYLRDIATLRALGGAVLGKASVALDKPSLELTKHAKMYREMRDAGGLISWAKTETPADIESRIRQLLGRASEPTWKKVAMTPTRAPLEAVMLVRDTIETVNDTLETMTRLAAYTAARDAGLSVERAAAIAKESTVNFNRSGKHSAAANVVYAFFSARMQGGIKSLRMLQNNPVRFSLVVTSLIKVSFALTLWNLMMAGDDDEKKNKYTKIEDWVREKNVIFMNPNGGETAYFKKPLGFIAVPFWRVGEQLALMAYGKASPDEAAVRVIKAFMNAYNPLSLTGDEGSPTSWLKMVAPTFLVPGIELSTNTDWLSRKIYPDRYGDDRHMPRYLYSMDATPPFYTDLAEYLNTLGGGSRYHPAKMDVLNAYPDVLEHVFKTVGGGTMTWFQNVFEHAQNQAAGVETPPERHFFWKSFVGGDPVRQQRTDYFDVLKESRQTIAAIRTAVGDKKEDASDAEAQAIIDRLGRQVGSNWNEQRKSLTFAADAIFKDAQRRISAIREERNAARNDENLSARDRRKSIDDSYIREREVMKRAVDRYRKKDW